MPYAAITYSVKPGHEDEIAEIFASFRRVDSPVLRNEDGDKVGELLGTAVFIKEDLMVRVIHYDGDFAAIGRHMARQQGVHLLEQRLAPYLAEQRDSGTLEGFSSYFPQRDYAVHLQLSRDTYTGDADR